MGYGPEYAVTWTVRLLLQAGADPTITNKYRQAPLVYLRENFPTHLTTIALVEQALADIEKT